MKKSLLLFMLCLSGITWTQQTVFHKQYYINPFVINPAFAGDADYMNLFLMHRSQWTGLPDAPITSTLTYDSPIIAGKNGIGLTAFADQTGIFRRNGGSANYAHRFIWGENAQLMTGVKLNVMDNRIDFSRVQVVQEGDSYVFQNNQNKTIIDGSLGLNFRYKRLDLGAVYNHIGRPLREYQDIQNLAFYRQEQFLQAVASYDFIFNTRYSLQPIISFRYFDRSPAQVDLNLKFEYNDRIWAVGTFRPSYGFSAAAGFLLYDVVTVGYSYDLITNNLRGATGMSSEILVGIRFGNKKKETIEEEWVDTDGDGVRDSEDLEPNTPLGNMVNFQGRTIPNGEGTKETTVIDSSSYYELERQIILMQKEPISFFYDYDRSTLQGGQEDKLVKVVRMLLLDPNATLTLYGNADSTGSDQYNLRLAERRANTVKQILVRDFGIDPTRISIISSGERNPLTPYRAGANRRVDAVITPSAQTGKEVIIYEMGANEMEKGIQNLFPEGGYYENEILYTVQLGLFRKSTLDERWKNLMPLYKLDLPDGTKRYYTGIFKSLAAAETRLEETKTNGIKDAFVVVYYNGKRITLEQAMELEQTKGSTLKRR